MRIAIAAPIRIGARPNGPVARAGAAMVLLPGDGAAAFPRSAMGGSLTHVVEVEKLRAADPSLMAETDGSVSGLIARSTSGLIGSGALSVRRGIVSSGSDMLCGASLDNGEMLACAFMARAIST